MNVVDNLLKAKRAELSELKKEFRKWKKGDCMDLRIEIENSISDLEQYIRRFMKSNMVPAKVGGIIINKKLYDQFTKKLKGLHTEVEITEESLIVYYGKSLKSWDGQLELHDLSPHFEGHGEITKEMVI